MKGHRRNQSCCTKFFQNRDKIKESHPHITDLFDNETSREVKTEIIENCFKKDGNIGSSTLISPTSRSQK